MIKNYFFLNRFVIEANRLISDYKVMNLFSQEKDKLIIECENNLSTKFIELYVNPGQPHINIRTSYTRAKKNSVEFFDTVRRQRIHSFGIADDDRIIEINLDDACIYFTVRGKFTNVITSYSIHKYEVFKKTDAEVLANMIREFQSKNYLTGSNYPDLSKISKTDFYNDIKKTYPFISNDIIKELKRRVSEEEDKSAVLKQILKEILNEKISVYINEHSGEIHLAPDTFDIFEYTGKKSFDTLIEAQSYFLSKKRFLSEKHRLSKIIYKHLDRELKRTANKLNNLTAAVKRENKEEKYQQLGNLLLINISKIKSGMESIEVENVYAANEKVIIKLNPKLPAKKNVDYYFDKAKSEKINRKKSIQLLEQTKNKFDELRKTETKLKSIEEINELKELMKKMKIKDKDYVESKDDIKQKFKHYIIDNKFNVYVGKDSKNNDLLTTRFAKQNDYWFHARSVSGSHVVLRVENTKEAIPKSVLKKAAALAAYHSKAKTAGVVPVSFTFKKYVVKKKNMPTGTVHLLREDTLLVKPEIPKGCEFVTDE